MTSCPFSDTPVFSEQALKAPHAVMARLRNEAPVYRDPHTNLVLVSRFKDIETATAQPAVFSNDFGSLMNSGAGQDISAEEAAILEQMLPSVPTMLTADAPEHTRYRKLAMKAFSFKRVRGMGAYVETLTHELIDQLPDAGVCDFKAAFADKLPMYIIADQLGVARSDFDQFERWSGASTARFSGFANPSERVAIARALLAFQEYFCGVIAEKRKRPTDDLISDLANVDLKEEGDQRKLNDAELISMIQQILVAGNESTASTLVAGFRYLIEHPDTAAELRHHHDLIEPFIEEVLRLIAPVRNMYRLVKEETVLAGVPLKPGDVVVLSYGSGNRDEQVFNDSDTLSLCRTEKSRHLSFGSGVHGCIGNQLARLELKTAFPALLDRLENVSLDPDQPAPEYAPNLMLHGLTTLPIRYRKVGA